MSASDHHLIKAIDALLPQTQCTRCGYDACLPYAEAIALEGEDINRCPPGGPEGIAQLAELTGRAVQPLNPECGEFGPVLRARSEEHTSELQSRGHLVCRLLLEKKKIVESSNMP